MNIWTHISSMLLTEEGDIIVGSRHNVSAELCDQLGLIVFFSRVLTPQLFF